MGAAEASSADEDLLKLSAWNMGVRPDTTGGPLERAFAVALSGYPERPPIEVCAQIDLPASAGLGCSAAIGVAVLHAIDEALDLERSREELAEAAITWEKIFHGNPSGIDNTMSALGGVALFRKSEPLQWLHPNKPKTNPE